MSRSLISGLLKSGRTPASIQVSNPHPALREALTKDFAVAAFADNTHATDGADTWVFAVKPQVMKSVCEALMLQAQAQMPLIVSIAAGITSEQIDRWLGGGLAIVRCMPNTPALLGAGATGLFANARVTPAQQSSADALLKAAGMTV